MEISEDKKRILAEIESGIAVIIEGEAGTGKTVMGVLCGQKLLDSVLSWQRVLYLTFSKLAKRQITECVDRMTNYEVLSPESVSRMEVLNYHSLWWQLINKQYSFLEISQEPLLCTNELALMREKYPVVIIDEFQDTDVAQWDIIQLLAPKTLIVMADPAQTIHIWRGADPNRTQQLKTFFQDISRYKILGTRKLDTRHRASRLMSDHSNITWIELKVGADSANLHKMNLAKRYAKGACKDYAKKSVKNGKNVGILCLTNEIADDITSFLRERQTFKHGGYISEIPCMRLGAENSPFESTRSLVLQLHNDACRNSTRELHGFLANSVLQTYLPCQVKNCSATSRNEALKKRWSTTDKISGLLCEEFGVGLRELARFMVEQAKLLNCYCDLGMIGCLKHVGSSVSRIGNKGWKELSAGERRRKIDAAVLQYENALASSRLIVPISVMTVHQSKSREFAVMILPWFTNISWLPTESGWDTSGIEHENLFHTACTRAKEESIVIFPKGQKAAWPAPR